MIRWIERAEHRRTRSKRTDGKRKRLARLTLESLEDRIALATAMASPTLLDPVAAIRVDQDSYTIRGALRVAAKKRVTIQAYRDTNQNGAYDAGVDTLAGSSAVPKKKTDFSVPVDLQQDAPNQLFLIASNGKRRSAPVNVAPITEDSTAPTVTGGVIDE